MQDGNIELKQQAISLVDKNDSSNKQSLQSTLYSNKIEEFDIDVEDLLKTFSHQKKNLSYERFQYLRMVHDCRKVKSENFKYFIKIATQANYLILNNIGYYEVIKESISLYPKFFFKEIDKDVSRTLEIDDPLHNQLSSILYCYAIRNPSVYYCQGMNYIGFFLLKNGFNQQQTFWVLVQLIENLMMPDYFKDLVTISITSTIFNDIFQALFPALATKIIDLGMDSSMFVVNWYVCLFTKGFHVITSQYLFQYLILEIQEFPIGYVLIKISLAIMDILSSNFKQFEQINDYSALKTKILNSINKISWQQIYSALNIYQLDLLKFLKLQESHLKLKKQNSIKLLEDELKQKKIYLPNCCEESPICLHRRQIQSKVGEIQEVLILKTKNGIQNLIDKNYFPKNVNRISIIPQVKDYQQCILTHHRHICTFNRFSQMNLVANKNFDTQQSTYYPVDQLSSNQNQGEVFTHFTNFEDKYSSFSAFFQIKQKEQIDSKEQEQIAYRKNRYARVILEDQLQQYFTQKESKLHQKIQKNQQNKILQNS